MNDHEIASLSLTEVAACIADGRLSSRDVTRVCLDRIATLGRDHRSVVRCEPDAALAAAERADEEHAAGRVRGPLHGVPLAHKDMFNRQGQISACGSRILADHRPDHTAHVLERLDAAGALDIARLNMTEFATGAPVFGHNPITGTPRNPWNTEHGTGGSSSGPASAVAARLFAGALASGHRRVDPCSGLVLRRGRHHAHVRPGQPLRRHAAVGVVGSCRRRDADRDRQRAYAQRHRRARSA